MSPLPMKPLCRRKSAASPRAIATSARSPTARAALEAFPLRRDSAPHAAITAIRVLMAGVD